MPPVYLRVRERPGLCQGSFGREWKTAYSVRQLRWFGPVLVITEFISRKYLVYSKHDAGKIGVVARLKDVQAIIFALVLYFECS